MSEERFSYAYNRVLIDSTRILDPQFDDAIIYITGPQLEMLRNMTEYLNRLSTYASDYQLGYYLSPTVADFDDIQAIVADLEETLMGNPNTIWGYKDRWCNQDDEAASGGGSKYLSLYTVPAQEVLVLQAWEVHHDADTAKELEVYVDMGPYSMELYHDGASPPDVHHVWQGSIPMAAGDKIYAHIVTPGDGKSIFFTAYGYTMVVP